MDVEVSAPVIFLVRFGEDEKACDLFNNLNGDANDTSFLMLPLTQVVDFLPGATTTLLIANVPDTSLFFDRFKEQAGIETLRLFFGDVVVAGRVTTSLF